MTATPLQPARHVRPVGPVDVLVILCPDLKPDGSIAEAISELVANGTVRILDIVLVYKDDAGEVTLAEVTDVDGDGIPDLVAIQGDVPGLLTDADARAAVEALPAGCAVALLAWENTWAIRASMALRRKGALLMAHDRIPAGDIDAAMDELEAMIDQETQS
jgi:Family of unknown function (DUF6325)